MSIESVRPSNHLILFCPLLPPSIFPSIKVFKVFSNELVLRIRWPKYWSFSFSISPSNEYSGLISFRMDWVDLLAVQGTLKCLLQHHSSKASILWCSAFFIVRLSWLLDYMTTGKTIALTRWIFVGKVMSLLFKQASPLALMFPCNDFPSHYSSHLASDKFYLLVNSCLFYIFLLLLPLISSYSLFFLMRIKVCYYFFNGSSVDLQYYINFIYIT